MNILDFAKKLRQNQTETERLLWCRLRNKYLNGYKFKRQYSVGPYIVDFVNYQHKLVIELDGGQHNDLDIQVYDQQRTVFLEENGFRVLRFWDNDVHSNLDGVLEVILSSLATSPQPSPTRRGSVE